MIIKGESEMAQLQTREPDRQHRIITIVVMTIVAVLIIYGGFFLLPVWGGYTYLLMVILLLLLLVYWHWRQTAYRCTHCGHEFKISFWQDLITAHTFSKKYVKCPGCDIRDYATEVLVTRN
jgi:DNA-directed RNA polymerase subunit RPC12/RpoP